MSSSQYLFAELNEYKKLIEAGYEIKKAKSGKLNIHCTTPVWVTFLIRRGTSDLEVVKTVIGNEEYKILLDTIFRFGDTSKIRYIVDAGSNIGVTAVYFKHFFPDAHVMTIEPDPQNNDQLAENIRLNHLTNVLQLRVALWHEDAVLHIDDSFRDGKEWSLTVRTQKTGNKGSTGTVQGVPLEKLMEQFSFPYIDVLKMDIEGTERFLFASEKFLDIIERAVKYIVIEIHDEFNVRKSICTKMCQMGFDQYDSEYVTLFRKR